MADAIDNAEPDADPSVQFGALSANTRETIRLAAYPWATEQPSSDRAGLPCRPCVEIDASVLGVSSDVTGLDLPIIGRWTKDDGSVVVRYELPSGCSQRAGDHQERISLWIAKPNEQYTVPITLPSQLPSFQTIRESSELAADGLSRDPDWPSHLMDAADSVRDVVEQYVEFVNQLYDQPRSSTYTWEG